MGRLTKRDRCFLGGMGALVALGGAAMGYGQTADNAVRAAAESLTGVTATSDPPATAGFGAKGADSGEAGTGGAGTGGAGLAEAGAHTGPAAGTPMAVPAAAKPAPTRPGVAEVSVITRRTTARAHVRTQATTGAPRRTADALPWEWTWHSPDAPDLPDLSWVIPPAPPVPTPGPPGWEPAGKDAATAAPTPVPAGNTEISEPAMPVPTKG